VLAACGFHLRGDTVLPFASLAVTGTGNFPAVAQLRQAVGAAPRTRLESAAAKADANLVILREEQERVILSLNAAGRVREYELRLRITWRLVDRQQDDLIPRTEIILTRVLSWDDTRPLAKSDEEALLFRDMRSDAVQQIMQRVSAAKPA